MRLSILAAIAAITVTLLVACTNPNPTTPEIVAYNDRIIQLWVTISGTLVTVITGVLAYLAKRDAGAAKQVASNVSEKLDNQQEELLRKSDKQTNVIVEKTEQAVEQAAAMQPQDDGRRDRRATDKPIIGG